MGKKELYEKITNYFTDKPVSKVSLFGSFSREEDDGNSDIDLLINSPKPVGLIAIGRYISELESITHRKIDIATEGSLTPDFFNTIRKDLKLLYAR